MLGMVIRFIISALVLMVSSFILPGFRIAGFFNALLASLVIALLGYVMEKIFGGRVSPHARGAIGFLTAAVVIYLAQFIIPTMRVSIIGALLASVVIGLIDIFVPTELR